jgi:hypothetical protein
MMKLRLPYKLAAIVRQLCRLSETLCESLLTCFQLGPSLTGVSVFQQLKDALGEVVAEMENMDTADEG